MAAAVLTFLHSMKVYSTLCTVLGMFLLAIFNSTIINMYNAFNMYLHAFWLAKNLLLTKSEFFDNILERKCNT